ncbi:MAG: hypothetical protein LRY53_01790 [Burkholderiaceae bacterium]|nr:hypothetical protein [Burkholderiaceae bacterium]MCD8516765.1 hypothetical protein [Burkholderiaceae bacterium]MCD8536656.1 hypothetical protein [Burkholderiaceae bacterium]MCD8564404.1 hypothetical protein [Burkholderiaceae bacterium]
MTLIIPNALPPSSSAAALIEPFASRYPKLSHLFNARQAQTQRWLPHEYGCTPAEGLQLQLAGFNPEAGESIGSGLGALHAKETRTDKPVWVAQLCATVISQERATVVPLCLTQPCATDIAELEDTARPLFSADDDGIEIEPLGNGIWRVHAEFAQTAGTISPMALMGQDLGDWWPTHDAWRAWRKRVNEIQMAWHDHPVNQRREQRGLPAINSVWLYGGARGFAPQTSLDHDWLVALEQAAWRGDWQGWLEAWADIESGLLSAEPEREIVLTGDNRIVRLNNAPKRWWQNLFAKEQQNSWRSWWLNQN